MFVPRKYCLRIPTTVFASFQEEMRCARQKGLDVFLGKAVSVFLTGIRISGAILRATRRIQSIVQGVLDVGRLLRLPVGDRSRRFGAPWITAREICSERTRFIAAFPESNGSIRVEFWDNPLTLNILLDIVPNDAAAALPSSERAWEDLEMRSRSFFETGHGNGLSLHLDKHQRKGGVRMSV